MEQSFDFTEDALLGQLGGLLGMLLGASVLTVVELVDGVLIGVVMTIRHGWKGRKKVFGGELEMTSL